MKDLEDGLLALWQKVDDPTSPLGELVALCAAIRQCYHEQQRSEGTGAARSPSDTFRAQAREGGLEETG